MKLALNPFKNKKPGKKAEQEQKIEFELDEKVEKMLEQYRQVDYFEDEYRNIEVNSLDYETLEPTQIDILLQRIIKETIIRETPKGKVDNEVTGTFLSRIIQKSYKAGHNNFTLTTKQTQISNLGCELKGTQENPIQITIKGNTGGVCGYESENCEYNIQGNTGSWCGYRSKDCTYSIEGDAMLRCGYNSKNCTYNIQGSAGNNCGAESKDCTYNIEGDTGKECGLKSEDCEYNIQGNTGSWCGNRSENCTYTTPNKKTYRKMRKYVPKGNKVEYTEQ